MVDSSEKVIAEIAIALTKDIISSVKDKAHKDFAKLSVIFETGFKKFLQRNYKKYSKIKTLFNSSNVAIADVFESPFLKINEIQFDEDEFLKFIEEGNFCIITGQGGAGKSIFLKHIFIRYYNEARGRVPFFVELRNIPRNMTLRSYIHEQLKAISPQFDDNLFDFAMRYGKFLFLFDGFDELDHTIREDFNRQIIEFSYAYGDNLFIVSSRPDDTFQSWTEFHIAEIQGFDKKQALSLIKKIKYDNKVKDALSKLIRDQNLFTTHGAYLSNPLLCTIMVFTFDHGAEIPSKMHLFFSQVYDVLFFKHDATKGTAFRRKFLTSLPIDEYRKAFSAFSIFSYLDFGPSLNRENALNVAGKSLSYWNLPQKPNEFLEDLCSATSLLIKEGNHYSYIHRSFQEYFSALFLSETKVDRLNEIIKTIILQRPSDSVVKLLSDINSDLFERDFLGPELEKLCDDLNQIDITKNPKTAMFLFFLNISASQEKEANNKLGFTVMSNGEIPKWRHLWHLLKDAEIDKILKDFDWYAYIKKFNYTSSSQTSIEFETITEDLFINTPMVDYLQALKEKAIKKSSEIKLRLNSKRQLLSDIILK